MREIESAALLVAVEGRVLVASELVRTELRRAAARTGGVAVAGVEALLDRLVLVRLESALLDAAGEMPPPALRSLDAIHIQSALVLGGQLEALVTYDARMADAARVAGLHVLTPRARD